MKKIMLSILFSAVCAVVMVGQPTMKYELPRIAKSANERVIRHDNFTMSYNIDRLTPTYVAWCLTPQMVNGKAKRTDFFNGDPSIEAKYRVVHADYYGSRYDRGHMCPAADNRNSTKAMEQCFYMTNMCPQNHALNAGGWNDLEVQCRSWARNYGKIYICAGPIYDNKSSMRRIGTRRNFRIAVPDRFYKVVLMVGAKTTKAIGFIYPNAAANRDMRFYAVSVDEVERITGIDFFYQLDDASEKRVEAECKPAAWGI